MCGIAGYYTKAADKTNPAVIQTMLARLAHRGPDDEGSWQDEQKLLTLGHRRLAILDLSPAGHQPMLSHSERFVISYNGEIYNYRQLQQELKAHGCRFESTCDTEVALAAFETWGIDALKRFNGMFAIALYDRKERELYLLRDRLGIKPLYYGWVGPDLVFGSELSALRVFPGFNNSIDNAALKSYIRLGYIPSPSSIFDRIYKLVPGSYLRIPLESFAVDSFSPWPDQSTVKFSPTYYWHPTRRIAQACRRQLAFSYQESRETLKNLLRDAVKMRLISDVPLGCFLSGGIDSSLITAVMNEVADSRIKTFSIGFNVGSYNEAEYAKKIAAYLGTEHCELYVSEQDALGVIAKLPQIYSEPFADSSQIPTFLLSELTRRQVTVSLSGDGGDELFSGYERYIAARNLWNFSKRLPAALKKLIARVLNKMPEAAYPLLLKPFTYLVPTDFHRKVSGPMYQRGLSVGLAPSRSLLYLNQVSQQYNPDALVAAPEAECRFPFLNFDNQEYPIAAPTDTEYFQFIDLLSYLPDDILCKVDRASMAVALEVRVPLLDYRIVEHAWSIPLHYKLQGTEPKVILKDLLSDYLPTEMFQRPKQGFAVPLREWLRGELREWAADLLHSQDLKSNSLFHQGPIMKMWQEHQRDQRDWSQQLWTILMFLAWRG